MKKQTGAATPQMPMPYLLFSTFAQSFFQLPNGLVQVVQSGEPTKTITRSQYENIAAVFNR